MKSIAYVARAQRIALPLVLLLAAQPTNTGTSRVARAERASEKFADPPVLRNESSKPGTVEVTLTASRTRVELVPGKMTDVYAYNGTVPGPTIEAHEGDHVIIHFHNKLPEGSTIHCHGVHLPAGMDGSPFGLIAPGGSFDYEFTVKRGAAGTYWYHPHPDDRSEYQVAMGLFGAFVVRAADDPLAAIPERLIILSDNRFRDDGAIDFADTSSMQGEVDEENGREGNVMLVNGRAMPSLDIGSGEVQRWRVINVSAARVFRLALKGQSFQQVGSDGGLFEHPVEMKEIVLANSERAELLVRGTGPPGAETQLQDLPYDRYMPQTRPSDWSSTRPLLSLRTRNAPAVAQLAIPAVLRVIPVLDTTRSTATRTVVMSQGLINGAMMDMHRVDIQAKLGATEIWRVENVVGMDHPFHLHGFQFQLLDRNGVPEKFRSWKDVVNVPKHEYVRFVVRYDDFPGRWMFHCHILAHEDHGMMAVLEVQ